MQHLAEPKKSGSVELTPVQAYAIEVAIYGKQTVKVLSQSVINASETDKALTKGLYDMGWLTTAILGSVCCVISMVSAGAIVDRCESLADEHHETIVVGAGLATIFAFMIFRLIKSYRCDREIRRCDKQIAKCQKDIRQCDADIIALQQLLNGQHVR